MADAEKDVQFEKDFDRAHRDATGFRPSAMTGEEFRRLAREHPFTDLLREDNLDACLASGGGHLLLPAEPFGEYVPFINETGEPPYTDVRLPTLDELEAISDLETRAWALFAVRLNATCERSKALIESVADIGIVGLFVQAGFSGVEQQREEPSRPFFGRRRPKSFTGNLFEQD